MIRIFEAFAGYGTATFALKQLGLEHEVIGFSEIDKYAIQCFQQNHCRKIRYYKKEEMLYPKNFGDISKIDWKQVLNFDLLTGGFPCQDVSNAGKQDLSKGRSVLGFELTRALIAKQPKYFMFENVKGILSKKFKPFLKELLKQWRRAGYVVQYDKLNTREHGIPQNRERVFFIGIREDIKRFGDFKFPEPIELKLKLKDLLEEEVDEKYFLTEQQIEKLLTNARIKSSGVIQGDVSGKKHNSQQDRIYQTAGVMCCIPNARTEDKVKILVNNATERGYQEAGIGDGVSLEQPNSKTRRGRVQKESTSTLQTSGQQGVVIGCAVRAYPRTSNSEKDKEQGRSQRLELNKGEFANSITNVQKDSMIFNGRVRRLTPKECFRLQGFLKDEVNLDGLRDTQKYKLAGNGQSVNVVKLIFKELLANA